MRQQESLTRMNEIKAAAVLQAPSIQQPTTTSYLQLEFLTRMNEIKAAAVLQAPSSQQPTTTSAMQLESLTRMNEIKATAVLQAPSSQQPVTPSGMQLVKLAQQGQHGTSDKYITQVDSKYITQVDSKYITQVDSKYITQVDSKYITQVDSKYITQALLLSIRKAEELSERAHTLMLGLHRLSTSTAVVSRLDRGPVTLELTMRDMSGLLPGRWLNDEVINFYLTLIQRGEEEKSEGPVGTGPAHAFYTSSRCTSPAGSFYNAGSITGSRSASATWCPLHRVADDTCAPCSLDEVIPPAPARRPRFKTS
eukprot:gene21967-29023_t